MIRLINKVNTIPATGEFPFGKSADNTGANNGTPLNANTLEDWHQFFEKMMDVSAVVANGEPDNAYTGFQLYEALVKASKGYKSYTGRITQSGSADPTVVIHGYNTIGSIVWTRAGTGQYYGTLTGAFANGKTICIISGINTGFNLMERGDDNTILVLTTNTGGTNADGKLTGISFEIRVYP